MITETFKQFLDISRELERQCLKEEHARDMEILEVADNLTRLISIQISSLQRRLEILERKAEGAQIAREMLKRKQQECEAQLVELKAEQSPANLAMLEAEPHQSADPDSTPPA